MFAIDLVRLFVARLRPGYRMARRWGDGRLPAARWAAVDALDAVGSAIVLRRAAERYDREHSRDAR